MVLDRLSHEAGLAGFDQSVGMMTGASGGMVGAAYYVSHLYHVISRIPHRDPWLDEFVTNPLPRLADHIAMEGLPMMLLPRLPWLDLDRGIVLEDQFVWRSTRKPALGMPIQDLRELERKGSSWLLIFSPVIVDDGRRLLISNLDLAWMAVNRGDDLIESGQGPRAGNRFGTISSLAALSSSSSSIRTGRRSQAGDGRPDVGQLPVRLAGGEPPLRPPAEAGRRGVLRQLRREPGVGLDRGELEGPQGDGGLGNRAGADSRLPGPGRTDGRPPRETNRSWTSMRLRADRPDWKASARDDSPGRSSRKIDSELSALIEVVNEKAGPDYLTTVTLENSSRVQAVSLNQKQSWPGMDVESNPGDVDLNTEVAMTWYVSGSERQAMQSAIPSLELARRTSYKPESRVEYFDASPRARLRWIEELARRVKRETIAARRDAISKDLERALNFERIEALKEWWKKGR